MRRCGRRFACILVEDSGRGMTPEELERAFHPFFSTKANGTGLGLPISVRIVEEHGGTVEVQSRTGEGSTFRVLLPLATEEEGPRR